MVRPFITQVPGKLEALHQALMWLFTVTKLGLNPRWLPVYRGLRLQSRLPWRSAEQVSLGCGNICHRWRPTPPSHTDGMDPEFGFEIPGSVITTAPVVMHASSRDLQLLRAAD